MYLSELSMEEFRCFERNFEIELNGGINVIVGGNGSGFRD